MKIDTENKKSVSGTGGKNNSIGVARIPIPLRDLNLVINVRFQIMGDDVPSLLSMKDMKDNGIEISIQKEKYTIST